MTPDRAAQFDESPARTRRHAAEMIAEAMSAGVPGPRVDAALAEVTAAIGTAMMLNRSEWRDA
ncbi:hypothetical protein A6A04_13345 [Paramagnetospirillum marisnigri]|uniref:Uncharacterized protein n=1 Tax=Paramagnetospirillum marisnigri TaxID=1285242 RepID=A0A178MX33_9PROT|nr:hypothetical protein A6A04_13345 [Paramagnetospirillum marisnigri]